MTNIKVVQQTNRQGTNTMKKTHANLQNDIKMCVEFQKDRPLTEELGSQGNKVETAIAPKVGKPEIRFFGFARRLIVLYICVKFHENVSNGFKLQSKHENVTDRRTQGKTICLTNPTGKT